MSNCPQISVPECTAACPLNGESAWGTGVLWGTNSQPLTFVVGTHLGCRNTFKPIF